MKASARLAMTRGGPYTSHACFSRSAGVHFRALFAVRNEHAKGRPSEPRKQDPPGCSCAALQWSLPRNLRSPSWRASQPNSAERMNFCHGSVSGSCACARPFPFDVGHHLLKLDHRSAAARSKRNTERRQRRPTFPDRRAGARRRDRSPTGTAKNPPGNNIAGVPKRGFNGGYVGSFAMMFPTRPRSPFSRPSFFLR